MGRRSEARFSCIDVPVDINGRHAVCDRASSTNTNIQELPWNSCGRLSLSSGERDNNGRLEALILL